MPNHLGFGDSRRPEDFVYLFDSDAGIRARFVSTVELLTPERREIRGGQL
jgi:hypothetical protein